ncbi:hypothetical protein EVAR_77529_1 [Eumeta japonica]|uniref:Uncharacterized protein n=1 Tax=Eumeta variegata TaxID=151549 RepID=A0A4C1T6G8_EUMVA|nr:hypothetical protein EVAR_77529_1 [Eumeta japonica]
MIAELGYPNGVRTSSHPRGSVADRARRRGYCVRHQRLNVPPRHRGSDFILPQIESQFSVGREAGASSFVLVSD